MPAWLEEPMESANKPLSCQWIPHAKSFARREFRRHPACRDADAGRGRLRAEGVEWLAGNARAVARKGTHRPKAQKGCNTPVPRNIGRRPADVKVLVTNAPVTPSPSLAAARP